MVGLDLHSEIALHSGLVCFFPFHFVSSTSTCFLDQYLRMGVAFHSQSKWTCFFIFLIHIAFFFSLA